MIADQPIQSVRAPLVTKPAVFAFTSAHGVAPLGPTEADRQESVANMIKGWTPSGIFFGGDNVWPEANESTSDIAWDYWLNEIAEEKVFPAMGVIELAAGYPIHELVRFPYLPAPKTFYKIAYPLVTFFVLNTQLDQAGSDQLSDQRVWLFRELDASTTHWNIVVKYGTGWTSTLNLAPGDPEHRWPTEHSRVDLVLGGQQRNYERFAIAGKPVIINVGIGGAEQSDFNPVITPGSAFRTNVNFGAVRLTITDSEMDLSAFGSLAEFPYIFDRLTLVKDACTKDRVRSVPATK